MREVAISNRLLTALADLYATRFKPSPEELVLKGIDPWNFRKRAWRRIIERAGIGHRSIKDLRDTRLTAPHPRESSSGISVFSSGTRITT